MQFERAAAAVCGVNGRHPMGVIATSDKGVARIKHGSVSRVEQHD